MAKPAKHSVSPQQSHQLYDEDIVLWSEQQAGALRALRGLSDLPAELDIDNVAEEIEAVARSETAAVKSFVRLILLHVAKIAAEPESKAVGHWLGEIIAFSDELKERFAPSMRSRVDVHYLWRSAMDQLLLSSDDSVAARIRAFPSEAPVTLDQVLGDPLTMAEAVNDKLGGIPGIARLRLGQPRPR